MLWLWIYNSIHVNGLWKLSPWLWEFRAPGTLPGQWLLLPICEDGYYEYFFFVGTGFSQQKKNTYKKNIRKEFKKIIGVRKWCWNAHKMTKNWLRRFKNIKIKIWQYIFNWWESYWQRKFNLRKKSSKSDIYVLN